MMRILLVSMLLLVLTWANADKFRIGSFKVQIFGSAKSRKPQVMSTLAKIIQRYDILLVQDIRDKSQKAIYRLLMQANDLGPHAYDMLLSARLGRSKSKEQYAFLYRPHAYDMLLSARLGRSKSKEQYAFLYRNASGINVLDTYLYPDANDEFEREPYAVRFESTITNTREFILAGVHVDPDTAVQEINSLVTVHADLQRHWETDNILIMGDFNADCSYVGKRALETLELREAKFHWLIGDDVDTTTKSTDCAYDRFVMTGSEFLDSVVPASPDVYRYDTAFSLDEKQTTAVSDDYPIELELRTHDCQNSPIA